MGDNLQAVYIYIYIQRREAELSTQLYNLVIHLRTY